MKKITVTILVFCMIFLVSGQAWAIYTPPTSRNIPVTQVDIKAGEAFINNLKFDTSQISKNIIKIILPKTSSDYIVWGMQLTVDKNNIYLGGKDLPFPNFGGATITTNPSNPATTKTWYYIVFSNYNNARAIAEEYYEYSGGATVKYIPVQNRVMGSRRDDGSVVYDDGYGNDIDATNPLVEKISPFRDLSSGFWAFDVIKQLYSSGYIKGYPDGTFKPAGNITRAEFAVMLRNVVKDKYSTGATFKHDGLDIVSSGHWSAKAVNELFTYMPDKDITMIFGTLFDPDKIITREEVVAVLASTLANNENFVHGNTNASLNDINNSPFIDGIAFSVDNGLVVGYPDGTFKPQNNITRAEISAVMVKVLSKI